MREIKFRAWDMEERCFCSIIEIRRNLIEHDINKTFIDEIVFMQYTGLKDRNGVEIYEGDIIYTVDGYFTIVWDIKQAKFGIHKGDTIFPYFHKKYFEKVIGNIYENKELLSD